MAAGSGVCETLGPGRLTWPPPKDGETSEFGLGEGALPMAAGRGVPMEAPEDLVAPAWGTGRGRDGEPEGEMPLKEVLTGAGFARAVAEGFAAWTGIVGR